MSYQNDAQKALKKQVILGIDPGPEQSAFVLWDGSKIISHGICSNDDLIVSIRHTHDTRVDILAVEMIASYGMPVGRDIFETCLFIGQIKEAWKWVYPTNKTLLVYRREIKLHFCNSSRAKDSNIRQALIDRFGPPGTKKDPGSTFGIKADMWAALAIAIYAEDKSKG